MALTAEVNWEQ